MFFLSTGDIYGVSVIFPVLNPKELHISMKSVMSGKEAFLNPTHIILLKWSTYTEPSVSTNPLRQAITKGRMLSSQYSLFLSIHSLFFLIQLKTSTWFFTLSQVLIPFNIKEFTISSPEILKSTDLLSFQAKALACLLNILNIKCLT